MTLSSSQVKKLTGKSSTVAIRDDIAKVPEVVRGIMRDNISGNIEKSLLVVEQVKDLTEYHRRRTRTRERYLWRGAYRFRLLLSTKPNRNSRYQTRLRDA
jgi:hypothetical protein